MPWIFLLLPWLELWTLIELGSATSALTALAYVFITLVLGLAMIRRQGMSMLQQMQRDAATDGFITPRLLMDELALVSSGLLLMIPGMITDVLALLVLIGPLRRKLLGYGVKSGRWTVYSDQYQRTGDDFEDGGDSSQSGPRPRGNVTLEGDYRRLDD